MPRQITSRSLRNMKKIGRSPVPRRRKRARVGKMISPVEQDERIEKIGKMTKSLTKTGQISQADKNMSMKELSRTIMSSIGCGVVTQIPKDRVSKDSRVKTKIPLKTNFSLRMTETDTTIIPNDKITDGRALTTRYTKAPSVPATKLFKNFEKNTLFEPEPQEELKEVYYAQQKLKTAETSNLIDITGEILTFQQNLKSDMMLPVFKMTQKFNANPDGDDNNYEFKDFSDPNLNYDFDEDEIIKNN